MPCYKESALRRTRPRGVTLVRDYSLAHLSDGTLLNHLASIVSRDRATTVALVATMSEADARRRYRPAAYPSMYAYCLGELHMSEDAACRRIRAARAGRDFPAVFEALAAGRVNLTVVFLLAPHLTRDSVDDLLAAATHKSKSEVERLLAARFPMPDLPTVIEPLRASASASGILSAPALERVESSIAEPAPTASDP